MPSSIRAYIIIKRGVVVVIMQSSGQQTHINIIDDGQHLQRVAINGRNSVKSLIITRIQQQALAIDVTSSHIGIKVHNAADLTLLMKKT